MDSGTECMALQETFNAVLEVSRVLKAFYTGPAYLGKASVPPWKWELALGLDDDDGSIADNNASFANTKPRAMDDRSDLASSSFYFVLDNVAKPLMGEGRVSNVSKSFSAFFNMNSANRDALTAGNLVRNTLVCDFEAVTFCHKGGTRRNLIVSFILAYAFYTLVLVILDATTFTSFLSPVWRTVVFVVVVPGLAFQLAYGVGPSCFPMIPTCLLEDVVLYIQGMLPIKLVWPNSLQVTPGCLGNATSLYGKQQCLRSCRGGPFYFRSWESSLSWAVCGLAAADPTFCQNGTQSIWLWPAFVPRVGELEMAMQNHSAVIVQSVAGDSDLWHGHQFCFFVTLGQAIPYLFVALAAVLGAFQLVKLPFAFVAAAGQFLWQAVAFTHAE